VAFKLDPNSKPSAEQGAGDYDPTAATAAAAVPASSGIWAAVSGLVSSLNPWAAPPNQQPPVQYTPKLAIFERRRIFGPTNLDWGGMVVSTGDWQKGANAAQAFAEVSAKTNERAVSESSFQPIPHKRTCGERTIIPARPSLKTNERAVCEPSFQPVPHSPRRLLCVAIHISLRVSLLLSVFLHAFKFHLRSSPPIAHSTLSLLARAWGAGAPHTRQCECAAAHTAPRVCGRPALQGVAGLFQPTGRLWGRSRRPKTAVCPATWSRHVVARLDGSWVLTDVPFLRAFPLSHPGRVDGCCEFHPTSFSSSRRRTRGCWPPPWRTSQRHLAEHPPG
jgi:hypothetical protein